MSIVHCFDTSCLNYFARVGQLELLVGRYSGRATAAAEVRNELRIGAEAHPALVHVVAANWIVWRSVETVEGLAVFGSVLSVVGERGRGEAGTVAVAFEGGFRAVLDDLPARNVAGLHGVEITGTIGILARMARDEQVTLDEAWRIFNQMRDLGFRSAIDQEAFRRLVGMR